jgi:CubicO group peptidase (beta-lactamase class C family)
MLYRFRSLAALFAPVTLLAACQPPPSGDAPGAAAPTAGDAAEIAAGQPPSAATLAMRWQLLNPEVNSFTFRETGQVFAYRTVAAPGEARALPEAGGFAMPQATLAGRPVSHAEWADGTFTNALLVLRDGAVVFEDYRNRMTPETRHIGFSMSKTITAMLVGQALEKGEIDSLDDPAVKYVPELAGGGYDGVTVRNLLEMRSGADIDERYDFGANPSLAGRIHTEAIVENRARFADFAVDVGRRAEPGATFNYATLDTAVLGWVLEKATGQSIEDLTETRLWQPIGAEHDGFWLADGPVGEGRALNGMGFNATLRDFARLGQLLLDDGMAGETRVLPEGWVAAMTTMKPTGQNALGPMPGYGFQTWQLDGEPGAYAALGLAGQFIYVHPASRTVIVKLSYLPPVPPPEEAPATLAYFKAIAAAN